MSVGINLMYNLVRKTSKVLQGKDFDQEIIELHHRQKRDAPSGTAKRIAEIMAKATGKDLSKSGVYGRRGTVGERRGKEIGIHSVRGGTVVGEHTAIFAGNGERLEITHRAESRRIFALGAILAARFITQKEKGLYDLQDALGIRETV
jgi:4-hydroxy-tetrahydrodipicolinate reductase